MVKSTILRHGWLTKIGEAAWGDKYNHNYHNSIIRIIVRNGKVQSEDPFESLVLIKHQQLVAELEEELKQKNAAILKVPQELQLQEAI